MKNKREQIIDTAIILFSRDGFHATGVDTIIAESDVTKRTLYNHFSSKDDLVLAALRKRHDTFVEGFCTKVLARSNNPKEQLLAIFDVAHEWFQEDNFYGCVFVNAIGEYAETKKEVRVIAQAFKKHIRDFIIELAQKAGAKKPSELGKGIALLLEGSIVTAQVSDTPEVAIYAKELARKLIAEKCP
jgi:AcrR family transcriptional regulator